MALTVEQIYRLKARAEHAANTLMANLEAEDAQLSEFIVGHPASSHKIWGNIWQDQIPGGHGRWYMRLRCYSCDKESERVGFSNQRVRNLVEKDVKIGGATNYPIE